MTHLLERLELTAHRQGISSEEFIRQHVRESFLRRLTRSSESENLLLRGSMLLRAWAGAARRPAQDLDFLGLFAYDLKDVLRRFQNVAATLSEADGVRFVIGSFIGEETWKHTDSPGIRVMAEAEIEGLAVPFKADVGFGDPVAPDAEWFNYPTSVEGMSSPRVLAVRHETSIGWKLHCVIELGPRRWRPKQLYDLLLFAEIPDLNADDLCDAIRTAFTSRKASPEEIFSMLDSPEWLTASRSLKRWNDFRETSGYPGLPDLESAARTVLSRFRPSIEAASVGVLQLP